MRQIGSRDEAKLLGQYANGQNAKGNSRPCENIRLLRQIKVLPEI
jgi:hypothetical protein